MRAQIWHIAIIAAIACVACNRGAPRGRGVPLRREIGMPDEPPAAFLVSGEHRTPGVRYVADWPTARRPVAQRPTTPVPWPSEFLRTPPGDWSIAFATTIEPDHLVVHAYRELDASGEPTGEAAETFECDGFSARACQFVHDRREIHLDGVQFVADAPYVVAFAYWHIPAAERLHADVANASASWLFVVRSGGRS